MPFAIELFLDEASAAPVRDLWRALAEAGISDWQFASDAHPHITLAAYPTLDLPAVAPALAAFAAATPPLPVTLASIGCFPTAQGVVFLAPVVTRPLLELHEGFHAQLAPLAPPAWAYYRPGHWVPHCTLTLDMPPERIPAAIRLVQQARLPLAGRLDRLGVVEFRPVVERGVYPLAGV